MLKCIHNYKLYVDLAEFSTTLFGYFHMIFVFVLCITQCCHVLLNISLYACCTHQGQLFILSDSSGLGDCDIIEVAIGADLCVIEEAADFLEEVPEKHKFMVTSCCPSWSDMVKKLFPQFEKNISVAFTPMVLTARMIKRDHPDCKVVFIGPCDSKKLEARRQSVRSDVDFVLTFEEALGIFAAKGMDKAFLPEDEEELPAYSSRDARRFAYSGGVAQAVVNAIHDMQPEREVKVAAATGLAECRKLLMMAKAGKYDGYLLEGMACPGGCIAGAGTLRPIEQSHKEIEAFSSEACFTCANDTPYMEYLPLSLIHI